MRVIDFIRDNADSMNEKDYFDTLNSLADAYSGAFSRRGVRPIQDTRMLVAHFFVQELTKIASGSYALKRDPSRSLPHTPVH